MSSSPEKVVEMAKPEEDNILLANSSQDSDVEMNPPAEEPEEDMSDEGGEEGEDEMVEEQGESE
jgi:hypothetical protein